MSTTEMTTTEPSFPILAEDVSGLLEVIHENLDGQDISPFDLTRIKVPSGGGLSWQISGLDGEEDESKVVEGVIILQKPGRAYWEKSYEEGSPGPPDCFSLDGITGQGNPGGNCETCALAQFGSASKGQACREGRSYLILREGEMFPSVLSIPRTGLKVMKKYLLGLALKGKPISSIVTSFSLTKEKNANGVVFSRVAPKLKTQLSDEQAEAMEALAKDFQPLFGKLKVVEEADFNGPTDITSEE